MQESFLNSTFQTKLLYALLTKPQFAQQALSHLDDSVFGDAIQCLIYRAIELYYNEYNEHPTIDTLELLLCGAGESEEKTALIKRELQAASSADPKSLNFLIDQVREFVGRRKLEAISIEMATMIEEGTESIGDIVTQVHRQLLSLSQKQSRIMSLNDEKSLDEWLYYRRHLDEFRVGTGYPILDGMIDGGVGNGELFLAIVGPKFLGA